jgi:hypothetical protein
VLRAPLCQGALLDDSAGIQKLSSTPEKDVRRGQVVERLVIALLVVMVHEGSNCSLQFAGKVIVFQTDEVLQAAMPALDFALAVVHLNTAANGGGIYNNGGSISVSNSRISYNVGTSDGAAIQQGSGSTVVSNTCIVCNGSSGLTYSGGNAVSYTGGTSPMQMNGNWWGSVWGPFYNALPNEGLQCSPGDSLNAAQPLATYNISVTPPGEATCGAPPVGNWLMSATGGCTGSEVTDVSSTDQSARICAAP